MVVPERTSHAAVTTSITPTTGTGNLGTTVTPNGRVYGITGGTTVGNNLYHSFAQFSVGRGDIAQYQTINLVPNASMQNILSRVTGGSPSSIFGTIDSATYYPNANFFFMNPTGILFGPNATVSVGGMVAFTTSDYLRLADGGRFNATPNTMPADLLTAAPVAAFGFLGPNPAAITFEGGQLTVAKGTGVTLVGGDISLVPDASRTPSGIIAHGRPIQLTSVAGPGEVAADTGVPAPGMNLGTITLGQGTTLDASGDPTIGVGSGGAVSIRGGQLVATGATILTNPDFTSSGQGGAVSITVKDTASLTDNSTIMTSSSSPNGDAGPVTINASHVILQNSVIVAEYSGDGKTAGNGGAVTLTGTDSVAVTRSGILTDTFQSNGNGGAISLTAPVIALQDSALFTGTFGGGSGGTVTLTGTSSVSLTRGSISTATVDTSGNSGSVVITAPTITIMGDPRTPGSPAIDTGTENGKGNPNAGNGGNVTITGTNVTFSNSASIQSAAASEGTFSRGGTIRITGSESILADNGTVFLTTTTSQGSAGDIQLMSKHVTITGKSILSSETLGLGSGGTINITGTDSIALESGSLISTNSAAGPSGQAGPAGPITLNTPQLSIRGGSIVRSQTVGSGPGGIVTVQGTNGPAQSVLISDAGSGIFTDTLTITKGGRPVGTGTGGDIFVNAHSVTLQNGGTLSAKTTGIGNAGDILVKADSVSITSGAQLTGASSIRPPSFKGEVVAPPTGNAGDVTIQGLASPAQSVLIDGSASGIFTNTQGTGAGGKIFMNGNTVTVQNRGTLSATTSGTAPTASGGTITVNANQVQLNNGGLITASTTGVGAGGSVTIGAGNTFASNAGTVSSTAAQATGGDITITAGQSVALTNGASISASSTGTGNAGNITINAGNQFAMKNSTVTTEANQASGGAIKITTAPSGTVQLTKSTISASVLDGTGGGGSVTIDPQFVILQNSQILAQAVRGPGGNILITTNLLLPDAISVISASSQFGVNGTVTIQSPISQAGGKIQPLGKSPLQATSLLSQRCAALAGGEFSSFTVAGRDSLPAEPGGWLSSPLALAISESGGSTLTEEDTHASAGQPAGETPLLSLRQIAPPGFLTQAFAVDWLAGCTS
jgi:filamentous hemagglutinin family protein